MLLVTAQQMRQAEATAFSQGLSYSRMMENAGSVAAKWIEKRFSPFAGSMVVLCGSGNNGGDGFVVARRLCEKGCRVAVVLACGMPKTVTAKEMFDRLATMGVKVVDGLREVAFAKQLLSECCLVIDGVFGIGFHGELPAAVQELFAYCRRLTKPMVALDLPSGVDADRGTVAAGTPTCVATIGFHAYQYGHILYPSATYCGEISIFDIGLPACEGLPFVLDAAWVTPLLGRPEGDTHKGTFGKAALLVGSYGMAGAAQFAVDACLRCGVGLAVPVVPQEIYPLVSSACPQGVYRVYPRTISPEDLADLCMDSTALLVGCGLGVNALTQTTCRNLVLTYPHPLVLDADGINSVAEHIDALRSREAPCIITPHPGEMARLLRRDVAYVQAHRMEAACTFAKEYGVVTVLKGAGTVVAAPDGRVAVNLTGNSGLSKGGTGDVLAGMTASFCAQGMDPFQAAGVAVWLHGAAAEMAGGKYSKRSMLPTDVIGQLPSLFLEFEMQ